jgi:hypothetical protein
MRRRELPGLHLIEADPDAPAGRLPGGLTPRQPPADDGDFGVFGFRFSVIGYLIAPLKFTLLKQRKSFIITIDK